MSKQQKTRRPKAAKPQLTFGERWVYAPAPESADHFEIQDRYELFIDGEFVAPRSRKYFDTINPATEEQLARVAQAGARDVDDAVAAARLAQEEVWGPMSGRDRARYVFRIARLVQERARELACLETMDGGKPIRESRDVDVPLAAQWFFYHAGWADKLHLAFPGSKVVLKPAETTPLTALHLAQIVEQAELPPGVVNIVTGDGKTGAALVGHPDVDKIAFTGSTAVGKGIQRALAGTGKDLTLELGGKAAHIIFEDAALDQAVEGVVRGIFFNQGHVCCAGSRLLVQESVHDIFIEKLRRRMDRLRVGDPMDKNTDMGAINSAAQLARIEELVAVGQAEGATLHQAECSLPKRGFWHRPSLFTGVSLSHRIAREEIFGPVLTVLTFRTPEEAVEKANNSAYGLSAGIWTDKGSRILWMAARMRAGVVWNNTFNCFDPASPFGGFKESGFGREGGRAGLLSYLHCSDDPLVQG